MADELRLTEIMKLHARRLPAHRKDQSTTKCGQVRILFEESHERDAVMSHASYLEGGSSIEAVFPEHLGPLKRHLEAFAFRIRINARQNKKKISTSVRLVDDGMTLALAVREPGQSRWNYFSKEQLKKTEEQLIKEKDDNAQRSDSETDYEQEYLDDEEAGEECMDREMEEDVQNTA